jgi:hypothetical protein
VRLYLVCNSEKGGGSNADPPVLGVVQMSAMPSSADKTGTCLEPTQRAVALLREALDLLDHSGAPPDVAARVQAAIDAVEEYRSA